MRAVSLFTVVLLMFCLVSCSHINNPDGSETGRATDEKVNNSAEITQEESSLPITEFLTDVCTDEVTAEFTETTSVITEETAGITASQATDTVISDVTSEIITDEPYNTSEESSEAVTTTAYTGIVLPPDEF